MRNRRRSIDKELRNARAVSPASLILLGLLIGLGGALYYARIVDPVVYTDASPARFNDAYKDEYLLLVSQAYAADGEWERAERRLNALGEPDLPALITELLERYLREQKSPKTIRAVALMAEKLGAEGRAVALFAPTPLAGLPTSTPTITPTSTPFALPTAPPADTPTPISTPLASPEPPLTVTIPSPLSQPTAVFIYRLLSQTQLCDGETPERIEVETVDIELEPLPGIKTAVTWQNGADSFFTGFKPSLGTAVGDFQMSDGVTYAVTLPDGSPEVSGLQVELCDNGRLGGWKLIFQKVVANH